MKNLIEHNEELFMYVKKVILKYCPFVEDRLYFLDDARKRPELDIEIDFNNNKTNIGFLFGNNTHKQGVIEKIRTEYYVDFVEVKKIIDFILSDHEFISYIQINNNKFILGLAINWSDKTIKGISCGNIKIEMNFHNNIELRNQYIFLVFEEYLNYLEKTPSFKKMKDEYLNILKSTYFNSMSKTELINLISTMTEEEIKQIISGIDNELFLKVISESNKDYKCKRLILEKNIIV